MRWLEDILHQPVLSGEGICMAQNLTEVRLNECGEETQDPISNCPKKPATPITSSLV